MSEVETRSAARDSILLFANLWLENDPARYHIKVRNLSDAGMMGEGGPRVVRGTRLTVDLGKAGAVRGSVAWVQNERFGVAFDDVINAARAQTSAPSSVPSH
ncbi:MAG: PilZ domain-containing protein [Marinomonas sp.]